jgi:hypothetical protein
MMYELPIWQLQKNVCSLIMYYILYTEPSLEQTDQLIISIMDLIYAPVSMNALPMTKSHPDRPACGIAQSFTLLIH